MTYSGTMISDLYARADNIVSMYTNKRRKWPSSLKENEGPELAVGFEPWLVHANARMHLADNIAGDGNEQAWWLLKEIQDCLLSGETDLCKHCGLMEGQHYYLDICPKQSMNGDSRLSRKFQAAL